MDCSIALTELYLQLGRYDKAREEYLNIVGSPASTTHSASIDPVLQDTWMCKIPLLAIDVMLSNGNVTKGESKYIAVQVYITTSMSIIDMQQPLAYTYFYFLKLFQVSQQPPALCKLPTVGVSEDMRKWLSNSTMDMICQDTELLEYIRLNGILVHPCEDISRIDQHHLFCRHSADNNNYQDAGLVGAIDSIGTVNLLDIVHHVYGGNAGHIFGSKARVFNILFAGIIDPQNVYLFMLQLHKLKHLHRFIPEDSAVANDRPRVQVCVMTEDYMVMRTIEKYMATCAEDIPMSIKFISSKFLTSTAPFDYIDYRNGISMREHFRSDLAELYACLNVDGVIGISAFSQNAIVRNIKEFLSRIDIQAHEPFSLDSAKLVKEYLYTRGYKTLAERDPELISFLSNSRNGIWQKHWTIAEMLNFVQESGLKEVSFLPSLARNPYGL